MKNNELTGDALLDEALKHIKNTEPPETLQNWVDYLSGKSPMGFDGNFFLISNTHLCR